MQIFGKEINDECKYCGDILECELFRQGHGIKQPRSNISQLFSCQMNHAEKREKNSSEEKKEVKEPMTSEVKETYTAIWRIHKENFEPRTDAEWEQLNRQCKLFLKMDDSQFSRFLVQAVLAEVESRMNGRKNRSDICN